MKAFHIALCLTIIGNYTSFLLSMGSQLIKAAGATRSKSSITSPSTSYSDLDLFLGEGASNTKEQKEVDLYPINVLEGLDSFFASIIAPTLEGSNINSSFLKLSEDQTKQLSSLWAQLVKEEFSSLQQEEHVNNALLGFYLLRSQFGPQDYLSSKLPQQLEKLTAYAQQKHILKKPPFFEGNFIEDSTLWEKPNFNLLYKQNKNCLNNKVACVEEAKKLRNSIGQLQQVQLKNTQGQITTLKDMLKQEEEKEKKLNTQLAETKQAERYALLKAGILSTIVVANKLSLVETLKQKNNEISGIVRQKIKKEQEIETLETQWKEVKCLLTTQNSTGIDPKEIIKQKTQEYTTNLHNLHKDLKELTTCYSNLTAEYRAMETDVEKSTELPTTVGNLKRSWLGSTK